MPTMEEPRPHSCAARWYAALAIATAVASLQYCSGSCSATARTPARAHGFPACSNQRCALCGWSACRARGGSGCRPGWHMVAHSSGQGTGNATVAVQDWPP